MSASMQRNSSFAAAAHQADQGDFSGGGEKSAPKRVLIVDDEPLIRWSLSETLADAGCEVSGAGDAAQALSAVSGSTAPFDAVFLDLRLPDSQDLKLLAKLRERLPDARLILMTAHGSPEVFSEALAIGAFRIVGKPFEMSELVALVA